MAQNGEIGAPDAGSAKTSLTVYGSLDSYNFWTWSWVNAGGTVIAGYKTDTNTLDNNLTYAPPA